MLKNATGHLKGLPSTTAAPQLLMTAFLTACKRKHQSGCGEEEEDMNKKKKLAGNEYGVKSLSSSQSIVSGT